MALITIFTAPKPFSDPFISTIQRNALKSWKAMGSQVDVILLGDESGIGAASRELGVGHIPEVETNQWGTPLVRSIFSNARQASDSPLMAVVNADILLFDDFVRAAERVSSHAGEFLMFGRRHGLNIDQELEFRSGWQASLRRKVERDGQLHPIFSIDYFVFRRDQYRQLPDFVIGRPQWDNWMIYHAHRQDWLVVDATPSVLAIHQNHDYRHLPGGKPPHGLEEGKRNRELAGGLRTRYLILDADRVLVDGELRRPKLTMERLIRNLERGLMKKMDNRFAARLLPPVRRLRRRFGDPLPTDGIQWGAGSHDENSVGEEET